MAALRSLFLVLAVSALFLHTSASKAPNIEQIDPEIQSEFLPLPASAARDSLILKLSAKNVPNKDTLDGKADTFIVISYKNGGSGKFREFAKTKIMFNNPSPVWEDYVIFTDFLKGADQTLKFDVYDFDEISSNDLIGTVNLNVDTCLSHLKSGSLYVKECQSQIGSTGATLYVKMVEGVK